MSNIQNVIPYKYNPYLLDLRSLKLYHWNVTHILPTENSRESQGRSGTYFSPNPPFEISSYIDILATGSKQLGRRLIKTKLHGQSRQA